MLARTSLRSEEDMCCHTFAVSVLKDPMVVIIPLYVMYEIGCFPGVFFSTMGGKKVERERGKKVGEEEN